MTVTRAPRRRSSRRGTRIARVACASSRSRPPSKTVPEPCTWRGQAGPSRYCSPPTPSPTCPTELSTSARCSSPRRTWSCWPRPTGNGPALPRAAGVPVRGAGRNRGRDRVPAEGHHGEIAEIENLVDELIAKLEKERAKREAEQEAERQRRELIGQNPDPLPGEGPRARAQTCPVAGPNSFVDSRGAPRSGWPDPRGHRHHRRLRDPRRGAQTGTVRFSSDPWGCPPTSPPRTATRPTTHTCPRTVPPKARQAGQRIGHVGSTGNAGDLNHLHFSYRPGGVPTNPYLYLLEVC